MANSRNGQLALLALSCLLCLSLCELSLRILTPFPVTRQSNQASHPRLGYVIDSSLPEIDSEGFRNRGVTLDDADIVVVGDSHAYGYNVAAEDSFPALLAKWTGRRIYNMGIPSYGIYHYMVLFHDIATMPARDVILAFYPANDLVLHCSITQLPYWRDYAGSVDITAPACEGRARGTHRRKDDQDFSSFVRTWLEKNSAVASALDKLVWNRLERKPSFRFPHGQGVSVVRVEKHARSTSLDNENVMLNFKNSQLIFQRANRDFKAAQIDFLVLFIPSREGVLFEWAQARGYPVDEDFELLIDKQRKLTELYAAFFREEQIAYLDAIEHVTSVFDAEVTTGGQFYPSRDEGHPLERGYEAYATAALELLMRGRTP